MEVLRASPRNPRAWKSAIDTISSFLTEAVFHFERGGVWLQALDPSMVVFVSMEAPSSLFSVYELSHPEVRVPISLSDYQRILSRLGPEDSLTMSLSSTSLRISMDGPGVRKEFVLPVLDLRESVTPVTMPQGLSSVRLPAQYLKEALRNASIVSRHVVLRTQKGSFVLEARESNSVARTEIKEGREVSILAQGEALSTYSVGYLQNILRGAEGEVVLEYRSDSPLRIFYEVEGIRMTFILAPLIL